MKSTLTLLTTLLLAPLAALHAAELEFGGVFAKHIATPFREVWGRL